MILFYRINFVIKGKKEYKTIRFNKQTAIIHAKNLYRMYLINLQMQKSHVDKYRKKKQEEIFNIIDVNFPQEGSRLNVLFFNAQLIVKPVCLTYTPRGWSK